MLLWKKLLALLNFESHLRLSCQGQTKLILWPYMAHGPNVPHPCSKQTGEIGQEGVRIQARSCLRLIFPGDQTTLYRAKEEGKFPGLCQDSLEGLSGTQGQCFKEGRRGQPWKGMAPGDELREPAGQSQAIWVEHHCVCWTQHRQPVRKSRGVETCGEEVARGQIIEGLWTFTLLVMGRLGDILGKAGHDLIYILKASMKLLFES